MNESDSWNDMILKAHFQSLNPKWNDQESVITLLHEIANRFEDSHPISAEERAAFRQRINIFIKSPAVKKSPLPMKPVGGKSTTQERKTGS